MHHLSVRPLYWACQKHDVQDDFRTLVKSLTLTLLYTGEGSLLPTHPPCQLWSLTAPTGRFGLVQSSNELGHMGSNYEQDPENASEFQQNLSYASCDGMIKNNPCKVGLTWLVYMQTPGKFIIIENCKSKI